MRQRTTGHIRREQKKSLLLRAVSKLFHALTGDHTDLMSLMVTRIDISADGGICYVFFTSIHGKSGFEENFGKLKLFKPSLRAALAREVASRYVPDLVFLYDDALEKQRALDALLDHVKEAEPLVEEGS